jgi:hypothetical protein
VVFNIEIWPVTALADISTWTLYSVLWWQETKTNFGVDQTIAIEVMALYGGLSSSQDPDGWTLSTQDSFPYSHVREEEQFIFLLQALSFSPNLTEL